MFLASHEPDPLPSEGESVKRRSQRPQARPPHAKLVRGNCLTYAKTPGCAAAGASLVAEADLRPDRTDQVAAALGRLYAKLQDLGSRGSRSCSDGQPAWPPPWLALAATRYRGGVYWPALWETTDFPGTSQDQGIWGRAFNQAIECLGMATFPELPLHFVGPILMHAGLPTYCLGDYFGLLLSRRRLDPGMDAEASWPGRRRRAGNFA